MTEHDTICATGPFLVDPLCNIHFSGFSGPGANFAGITIGYQETNYVNPYSKEYTKTLENHLISGLFGTLTTSSSLFADACIYRPGLLARDLWKWDLSGESDYGLIEPPINEPNYDLFDSNWSAQFIVHARTSPISCATLGLGKCSHSLITPRGPTADPYVACISKNYPKDFKSDAAPPNSSGPPDQNEPTYKHLNNLYKKTKECQYIKALNPNYLGCIYSDPANECSCDCPKQGSKFHEYLSCSKINSTFWSTPHKTPLFRMAQIGQLLSESIEITVSGFMKNPLKLGQIINVENNENQTPRSNSGKWMITSITYSFEGDTNFSMDIILNRDAL